MNRKQRRQQQKKTSIKRRGNGGGGPDMPLHEAIEKMISLYETGNKADAYQLASQALDVDADDTDLLHFAGTIALELSQFEEAKNHLEKVTTLKPDHAEAWSGLGHALIATQQVEPAIKACQKAAELLGTTPEIQYNLGNAYFAGGRIEEAIGAFGKALAIKPDYPDALNNMGNALQQLQQFDQACDAFRLAVKIKPNYTAAQFNLANTLWASGQTQEAISAFHDVLKLNSQHLGTYNNLGTVLRMIGRHQEAAETYRKGLAVNPDASELHSNLCVVLQELGQLEQAAESGRRALEINPANAEAAFNYHAAVYDDDDPTPATDALENALSADPTHEYARFLLGVIRERMGDAESADKHFSALDKNSQNYSTIIDSWAYIKDQPESDPRLFGSAAATLRHGLQQATVEGQILEFGVRFGTTLRLIAEESTQPVHGFDSFEGLPADWGIEAKGQYTTHGELPMMPGNVTLHAGLFENTLPTFISQNTQPVRFLHVDCDLYTSTATVFQHLAPHIVEGTIIVFDEYLMNPTWREDEFKAFHEAATENHWKYEYISFSLYAKQAGVRILATG